MQLTMYPSMILQQIPKLSAILIKYEGHAIVL